MAYGFNDDKSKEDVYSEQESQQQYYTRQDINTILGAYYSKQQIDNMLSQINTSLNNKQNKITGAATSVVSSNLSANRALVSDGAGKIGASNITNTKLGYLANVTSDIQAQINNLPLNVFNRLFPRYSIILCVDDMGTGRPAYGTWQSLGTISVSTGGSLSQTLYVMMRTDGVV